MEYQLGMLNFTEWIEKLIALEVEWLQTTIKKANNEQTTATIKRLKKGSQISKSISQNIAEFLVVSLLSCKKLVAYIVDKVKRK